MKNVSEHSKNCWLLLLCRFLFNIYTTAITMFTLHKQSICILSVYSIVKNQRREIPQPRPQGLILMKLLIPREKSTATQRDGARSSIQPWIDKTPQKIQQIVQVQEYTFSFASWYFLIRHGLFAENEITIVIFIWVCRLRNGLLPLQKRALIHCAESSGMVRQCCISQWKQDLSLQQRTPTRKAEIPYIKLDSNNNKMEERVVRPQQKHETMHYCKCPTPNHKQALEVA